MEGRSFAAGGTSVGITLIHSLLAQVIGPTDSPASGLVSCVSWAVVTFPFKQNVYPAGS